MLVTNMIDYILFWSQLDGRVKGLHLYLHTFSLPKVLVLHPEKKRAHVVYFNMQLVLQDRI
jgi:hypothetical protein